jgi:hypothetical protein
MSASNYNWVCFDCRFVTRHPKTAKRTPKCADCGADCHCLGYKVEIPKQSDARGWKKLHLESRRRLLARSDEEAVRRVRESHEAERRIAHLRSLEPNKDREKMITALKGSIRA